mmetsp:Transcript_11344/g.27364  ORF Transcript_11344/g.27364 Transcript_11344/m.27364 type:complete len:84 (-) Transcript_11344:150-401(-)
MAMFFVVFVLCLDFLCDFVIVIGPQRSPRMHVSTLFKCSYMSNDNYTVAKSMMTRTELIWTRRWHGNRIHLQPKQEEELQQEA